MNEELVATKRAEIENMERIIKGYKGSPKYKIRKVELKAKLQKLQDELVELEKA